MPRRRFGAVVKNGMDAEGTGRSAGTLYRACSTGLQKFLAARLNTLADVDRNQRTAREAPWRCFLMIVARLLMMEQEPPRF